MPESSAESATYPSLRERPVFVTGGGSLFPSGVCVDAIPPGWVMTERQLNLWVTPEGEQDMDRNQCLKIRLQPDDIARMVLFLAADDSRGCTAQNFIVDAGWA